jgi:acyl transferase domain-containing protein
MAAGNPSTPIAIIGMGCRFSGDSNSPEKLWDMLVQAKSGWTEIPESRFNVNGLYHPDSERVGTVCDRATRKGSSEDITSLTHKNHLDPCARRALLEPGCGLV